MYRKFAMSAAVLMSAVAGLAVWAAPPTVSPVFTSKSRFRIPFKLTQADIVALGAKQIQLFVSRDQGASWTLAQVVAPDSIKFAFEAPADGEYWFAVRTLDAQNRLLPATPTMLPELKVVVDSRAPVLKLDLTQPVAGRVRLKWSASDENLDITQLRLEYIQPGQPLWQPVSILPKSSGQTEWTVPQGGMVAVRGTVGDHAKNTTQDETQARIAATGEVAPGVPDFREPVAQAPTIHGGTSSAAAPTVTVPEPAPELREPILTPPAVARGPVVTPGPMIRQPRLSAPAHSTSTRFPDDDGFVSTGTSDAGDEFGPPAFHTDRKRQRVVASKQFQIAYKLEDVGPSGVSAVKLYITEDDGRTWHTYGTDDDRQSPFTVEVPRDGLYGFSIGVSSGAGLTTNPPQPGDRPTSTVAVDLTPPQIELAPIEQGRGRASHKLLIKWRYEDAFPAEQPVALYYSESPQGPWQPITNWQENTGRYIWAAGANVPVRVYIRMDARDAAGNIQSAIAPEPVLMDNARPTARILDVEPQ